MENTLATSNGGGLVLPNVSAFKGAVTDKGQLTGARKFIAARLGITIPKGAKSADVKTLFLAKADKDALKVLSKEYDTHRSVYYRQVNSINGALAADPSFRKTMKFWENKAGSLCVNVAYRKERSLSASAAQRADNAEAEVKQLRAEMAAMRLLLAPAAQS
jgi:hypothetical protein